MCYFCGSLFCVFIIFKRFKKESVHKVLFDNLNSCGKFMCHVNTYTEIPRGYFVGTMETSCRYVSTVQYNEGLRLHHFKQPVYKCTDESRDSYFGLKQNHYFILKSH